MRITKTHATDATDNDRRPRVERGLDLYRAEDEVIDEMFARLLDAALERGE